MFNYRQCYKCNEKFYGNLDKFTGRVKAQFKLSVHMGKEHGEWVYMVKTIIALAMFPLLPAMWVAHKLLYPFWWVYEWLDDIDCM